MVGPEDLVVTLSRLSLPGSWARRGRCREVPVNVFFPTRGDDVDQAKAICALCPVQPECRGYALGAPGLQGVWGGMSEKERRQLRAWQSVEEGQDVVEEIAAPVAFDAVVDSLDVALEELASFPGQWARVAHYQSEHSAHATASLLRTGRRRRPPGRWEFEGRVAEGGGSDLYAMVAAEDVAS